MDATPVVTIFVRHKPTCRYKGDEFRKTCNCRKHFRWSVKGKQYRETAGTRSWAAAEEKKRQLEDRLAGRIPTQPEKQRGKDLGAAIKSFLQDKETQGITAHVLAKYTRELARLREYCERHGVFIVQGLTREFLTGYCATWTNLYPASSTRAHVRERCRSFLRYCFESEWLARIPNLPRIKVEATPTMPLTEDEYKRLLEAVPVTVQEPERRAAVRALLQLMRWSGLAIQDALTIERGEIVQDGEDCRVVTSRQKTGTHVSVPIPHEVATELLGVANGTAKYVFWSGNGKPDTISKKWANVYIAPLFEAAGIESAGNMKSHRLRDTFACDLLQKGVPLEDVSKLLGHESIRTTEKSYAKWIKGRQNRLDQLVKAAWKK